MSDKLDLIYDLLKADREEASDFRKEVRDSHKKTDDRLSKLEAQGEVQNQQLAEHMRRTEVLEDLHMSNEGKIGANSERITKLEEPRKALSLMKRWFLGAGAVAGAAVAIAKFMGLF
jgi:hypothetical protein